MSQLMRTAARPHQGPAATRNTSQYSGAAYFGIAKVVAE